MCFPMSPTPLILYLLVGAVAAHDSCTVPVISAWEIAPGATTIGMKLMKRRSWVRGLGLVPCLIFAAYHSAHAQQAAGTGTTTVSQANADDNLDEIVVHGIKRGELILPTTVTSTSAYGLDLSVMDTPRNNTVLSKAQLDALNIQNPGGFSFLTSSSYSDASFGQPNVPRIRGQYADMFFNGMRDSFTLNGYGAPVSFNRADSIDIIKG